MNISTNNTNSKMLTKIILSKYTVYRRQKLRIGTYNMNTNIISIHKIDKLENVLCNLAN